MEGRKPSLKILREKEHFREIRRQKIYEYARRQEQRQRTVTDKEKDFEQIDEFQNAWVEERIRGPASTWERWDGMIEEWTPWNRFGEPINQWRYYKKWQ